MKKNKLVIITGAIVFSSIVSGIVANLTYEPIKEAKADTQVATCPAGSYDIGINKDGSPICKLEPTGCPWGDSIPLDSPKCAPPSDIICNTDWTDCKPKSEVQNTTVTEGTNNVSAPVNDTRLSSCQEK